MSVPVIISLDETMLGTLDGLAERTDRSREWLVIRAVEDFVASNEWQIQKIEAGIVAADRGDFASADDMARIRAKFTSNP